MNVSRAIKNTVKPVIQEEATGCDIASAATLSGMSYNQVKQIANDMGIYATDASLCSETRSIRNLLTRLGIQSATNKEAFVNGQSLSDFALLAIKWQLSQDKQYWHWVVFVREDGQAHVLDSKNP